MDDYKKMLLMTNGFRLATVILGIILILVW